MSPFDGFCDGGFSRNWICIETSNVRFSLATLFGLCFTYRVCALSEGCSSSILCFGSRGLLCRSRFLAPSSLCCVRFICMSLVSGRFMYSNRHLHVAFPRATRAGVLRSFFLIRFCSFSSSSSSLSRSVSVHGQGNASESAQQLGRKSQFLPSRSSSDESSIRSRLVFAESLAMRSTVVPYCPVVEVEVPRVLAGVATVARS